MNASETINTNNGIESKQLEFCRLIGYERNVINTEFETPGRKFRVVGFNYSDPAGRPLIVLDLKNNVEISMVANKQYLK